MTNNERVEKYIKEYCSNCKHRKEDLCEIRISVLNDVVITKCAYYEKDKKPKGYIKPLDRTAKVEHTVMRKLISDWSIL